MSSDEVSHWMDAVDAMFSSLGVKLYEVALGTDFQPELFAPFADVAPQTRLVTYALSIDTVPSNVAIVATVRCVLVLIETLSDATCRATNIAGSSSSGVSNIVRLDTTAPFVERLHAAFPIASNFQPSGGEIAWQIVTDRARVVFHFVDEESSIEFCNVTLLQQPEAVVLESFELAADAINATGPTAVTFEGLAFADGDMFSFDVECANYAGFTTKSSTADVTVSRRRLCLQH